MSYILQYELLCGPRAVLDIEDPEDPGTALSLMGEGSTGHTHGVGGQNSTETGHSSEYMS